MSKIEFLLVPSADSGGLLQAEGASAKIGETNHRRFGLGRLCGDDAMQFAFVAQHASIWPVTVMWLATKLIAQNRPKVASLLLVYIVLRFRLSEGGACFNAVLGKPGASCRVTTG